MTSHYHFATLRLVDKETPPAEGLISRRASPPEGSLMDSTTIAHHPHPHHDPDETSHGCIAGVVCIGHMVEDEHGDEVETFQAVPCRRCSR
jgi:hypothetical protein